MTNDIDSIRSALKDSGQGFRIAAEKVNEPELRALFMKYSVERAQFASQLGSGTSDDTIHRGWPGVKSALTVDHELAVLEEVERGENSTVAIYHEVLGKDLPAEIRAIVERQYDEIRKAHDSLRALLDSHWKKEVPLAGLV